MDLTLYQFIQRKKNDFREGGGLRLKMMIVEDGIRLLLVFPYLSSWYKNTKRKNRPWSQNTLPETEEYSSLNHFPISLSPVPNPPLPS